jgi:hypothetical protein
VYLEHSRGLRRRRSRTVPRAVATSQPRLTVSSLCLVAAQARFDLNFGQAAVFYERVLQLKPRHPEATRWLVEYYLDRLGEQYRDQSVRSDLTVRITKLLASWPAPRGSLVEERLRAAFTVLGAPDREETIIRRAVHLRTRVDSQDIERAEYFNCVGKAFYWRGVARDVSSDSRSDFETAAMLFAWASEIDPARENYTRNLTRTLRALPVGQVIGMIPGWEV